MDVNYIVCPHCKKPLKVDRYRNYNRHLNFYTTIQYVCEYCPVTAVSEKGIMTYYDENGKVIASGK